MLGKKLIGMAMVLLNCQIFFRNTPLGGHVMIRGVLMLLVLAHGTARSDETTSPAAPAIVEHRGLAAERLDEFLRSLPGSGEIVQSLSSRLSRGQQVFDVGVTENPDGAAWMVHVNLSKQEFEKKQAEYAADGFELICEQGQGTGRTRLYLGVWKQRESIAEDLSVPQGPLPIHGELGRDMEPLNTLIQDVLREGRLPGAVIAVAKKDQLVYERSFGYADVDLATAMKPDSVMRIASLSKPLTAVAILLLIQEDRLTVDSPLLPILARHSEDFDTQRAIAKDERWGQVTIRHLLQHTAGFDREASGDTMFELIRIGEALELRRNIRIPDVIRYQLMQPLDFEPGSRFCYSNIGYCLLGRVIEVVSGVDYDEFVTQRILTPVGMSKTRLGRTRWKDRADDEVRYHTQTRRKMPLVMNIVNRQRSREIEMVEAPYGQWDLELMDAHGGWTSTAADLVKFLIALESTSAALLHAQGVTGMQVQPGLESDQQAAVWYGLGWNIRALPGRSGRNYWHTGLLSGTSTLLVHRWDDCSWAVLFNCDRTSDGRTASEVIDGPLHAAVSESLTATGQTP